MFSTSLGVWSWIPLTKTLNVKSSAKVTKVDLSESTACTENRIGPSMVP